MQFAVILGRDHIAGDNMKIPTYCSLKVKTL